MSRSVVVWVAGTNWDAVPGTDKRLVKALSERCTILWVDPPRRGPKINPRRHVNLREVASGVLRLEVSVPWPAVTKFGIRVATNIWLWRTIGRALLRSGLVPDACVVAFPLARFPRTMGCSKVLYATDQWLAGADLMGFSARRMEKVLRWNLREADAVVAISAEVLAQLGSLQRLPDSTLVLPNGCDLPPARHRGPRAPRAVLLGQLNERLDADTLDALCEAHVPILVIGQRADSSADFGKRLDRFLAAPNVEWLGAVPGATVPEFLETSAVGLTPYTNSLFNKGSFPLKTLEYLASGLPVISSDLPASSWLATEHVRVCTDTPSFVRDTLLAITDVDDQDLEAGRRNVAKVNTWDRRAMDFLQLLEQCGAATNPTSAPEGSLPHE
ncbi:teichuronic acid biosynthesis glycosyltransferase TuaH [Paenarthrobacter nicotinovorans]|uniref:glycosyltransferase n=2 Tax=Paenarthrobacter nicotinovorans TaxID=29320 RepID=UPI00277F90DB|nr:glycosyltransferase [Paenarthrobacter nicotinovorans]MDP9934147.1 teichuronic acid biosynthesis glycosyltransferase TuaH [Paenarthrobacter nicotinovorans]